MASTGHFRLFDLPPELRNAIYTYHFEQSPVNFSESTPELASTQIRAFRYSAPSLVMVNKQVYAEALQIFWCSTTFTFDEYVMHAGIPMSLPQTRWASIKELEFRPSPAWVLGYGPHKGKVSTEWFKERLREVGAKELAGKVVASASSPI